MGTISITLPGDGSTADVADYNNPLTTIVSELNGNLDNANIKTGAAIATAKLADDAGITTAKLGAASVTNAKLSTTAGEVGGPSNAWVPTIVGFSVSPVGGIYEYTQQGKLVTLMIAQPAAGTSNAVNFTLSLPSGLPARTLAGAVWSGSAQIKDNGTVGTNPGLLYVASAATTVAVFMNWAGGAWTAAGNKQLLFGQVTYETT